jgi:hypothetical protein
MKSSDALGGHDAAEIEAVDIGFIDPGDQIVGHLLGRADDRRIAAAQPHPADYSPHHPRLGAKSGMFRWDRQSGLGAVERLDLALLVNRQHHSVGRQVDIEPDNISQLLEVGLLVPTAALTKPTPYHLGASWPSTGCDSLHRTGGMRRFRLSGGHRGYRTWSSRRGRWRWSARAGAAKPDAEQRGERH